MIHGTSYPGGKRRTIQGGFPRPENLELGRQLAIPGCQQRLRLHPLDELNLAEFPSPFDAHVVAALADAGRDEEAIGTYLDAMEKRSEPLVFHEKILPAFRRRAECSAAGDVSWYRYALVLKQNGRYAEAREVLKKTLAAAATPTVLQELSTLDITIRQAGLE